MPGSQREGRTPKKKAWYLNGCSAPKGFVERSGSPGCDGAKDASWRAWMSLAVRPEVIEALIYVEEADLGDHGAWLLNRRPAQNCGTRQKLPVNRCGHDQGRLISTGRDRFGNVFYAVGDIVARRRHWWSGPFKDGRVCVRRSLEKDGGQRGHRRRINGPVQLIFRASRRARFRRFQK